MTCTPLEMSRLKRTNARWAGVRLSNFTRSEFCTVISSAIEQRSGLLVTFLNPFYARATDNDDQLATVIDGFDIVQPDGWGVVYGARFAGIRIRERVAIEDVERPIFTKLADRNCRVFLFGSEPGVAEAAGHTLCSEFPGLQIVGTQHGWLDVERGHPGRLHEADATRVARHIGECRPHLVLVGLPTPMQQQWASRFAPDMGASVVMTVGAYFDKLAEGLDWYPRWMEALRLGWLYRVYREPRRLMARYSLGSALFVGLTFRHAVRARRTGAE